MGVITSKYDKNRKLKNIEKIINDKEVQIQSIGVAGLSLMKDKITIPLLKKIIMDDKNSQNQWRAFRALTDFEDESLIPFIVKLLDDGQVFVGQ